VKVDHRSEILTVAALARILSRETVAGWQWWAITSQLCIIAIYLNVLVLYV